MNDEIKEMTKVLKSLGNKQASELYYYITNLQQENERLKEKSINEVLKNDFNMCVKDLKKANKKIEKIDEYIKEHTTSFGDVFIPASESWYLSDILNGRSDE